MFDSEALLTLRGEVRECAIQSGISEDRAEDIVLAIHELAANAVVHDGGAGRLRVWKLAGDSPLPSEKGHGLWVVRKLADQVKTLSGPHGTSVSIAFDLPH